MWVRSSTGARWLEHHPWTCTNIATTSCLIVAIMKVPEGSRPPGRSLAGRLKRGIGGSVPGAKAWRDAGRTRSRSIPSTVAKNLQDSLQLLVLQVMKTGGRFDGRRVAGWLVGQSPRHTNAKLACSPPSGSAFAASNVHREGSASVTARGCSNILAYDDGSRREGQSSGQSSGLWQASGA